MQGFKPAFAQWMLIKNHMDGAFFPFYTADALCVFLAAYHTHAVSAQARRGHRISWSCCSKVGVSPPTWVLGTELWKRRRCS